MNRARLVLGLGLAAAAGWWAQQGREALPARPLRPSEACPGCPHLGGLHDPDLGCIAWAAGAGLCPCRRPGCRCPQLPPGAR